MIRAIPSFADLSRPLIVGSIRQFLPEEAVKDIRACEAKGARAFIQHIQLLDKQYRDYDSFRKIAAASEYPIMAIYYKKENSGNDEEHVAVQFEAVKAGFRSVDIPADTFDVNPRESLSRCPLPFAEINPDQISMRPETIMRQKNLIREFHTKGAEVLVSAHVRTELSLEQTVSLALEIQSRGADIVKIVADCKSPEQSIRILETNTALKKNLDVPFLYICNGMNSKFVRLAAPLFGSMLVFGHHSYGELSNPSKPLIDELNDFYRITPHQG